MQREYDKAVMLLSGGAFGVSLTFLKEVLGQKEFNCGAALLTAWVSWGASVTATLASYFTSTLAFRRAIKQFDDQNPNQTSWGGVSNVITKALNILGGALFFAGVLSIVVFVSQNLSSRGSRLPTTGAPTPTPIVTATATPSATPIATATPVATITPTPSPTISPIQRQPCHPGCQHHPRNRAPHH